MSAPTDNGAHYYATDLQVHTPRDANWKGPKATTPSERKAYAERFVAHCRQIGLQAVAITDHHDLLLAPIIRKAAQDERDAAGDPLPASQQLIVFPGLELTLALGRQALLVLDAHFPDDRLAGVIQALAITATDDGQSTLADVVPLEHIKSFAGLHEKLDEHLWLKDHYIVLPNVTDGGLGTILRKGMQAEYKQMPCVGGYVDGPVSNLGTGNLTKLAGEDAAWGKKPLGVFQTSDSRSDDFATLGSSITWVKWAEPTAEALRQACLGRQSRIVHSQPEIPSVTIERISVSASRFLGPIDLALNPQYTALIGGRGTGKSTILDYLRWGLCDQTAEADDDDLANPTTRRERLIEDTLRSVQGQVEVQFSVNDIPHVVRRNSETGEILLKVGANEYSKAREDDIRALLPIHAYSQKQLSSVALRLDELTRFVTAPIRRDLDGIDEKIVEVSGRFRENYARVQRARDLDAAIVRQRLAVSSLSEQAVNLRQAMTDLSEADRKTLEAKPGYDGVGVAETSAQQDLDEVETAANDLLTTIQHSVAELEQEVVTPESIQTQAKAVRDARLDILRSIEKQAAAAITELADAGAPESALTNAQAALTSALNGFNTQYEEVKKRSTAHETRLTELGGVERRGKEAGELLAAHERDRKALGDPLTRHAELRKEAVDLYRARSILLTDECERLTTLSDGLLKATINRGQGLDGVEQRFRAFVQGSGVRGARIDELFRALRSETDPLETWETTLDELEKLMLLSQDQPLTSELTPTLSRLGFGTADQQRIQGRLSADAWLDLVLTPVRDEPTFEYRRKEQEYIAFSAASAGQQATTLLRVLLAQGGMPLIIDQPEEDLDTQVVQEVVEQIWSSKTSRQLIFASHNANLVVNGDAELVVVCDYRIQGDQSGGKISLTGAIDIEAVRKEIIKIMEGGERALLLRKQRYGV